MSCYLKKRFLLFFSLPIFFFTLFPLNAKTIWVFPDIFHYFLNHGEVSSFFRGELINKTDEDLVIYLDAEKFWSKYFEEYRLKNVKKEVLRVLNPDLVLSYIPEISFDSEECEIIGNDSFRLYIVGVEGKLNNKTILDSWRKGEISFFFRKVDFKNIILSIDGLNYNLKVPLILRAYLRKSGEYYLERVLIPGNFYVPEELIKRWESSLKLIFDSPVPTFQRGEISLEALFSYIPNRLHADKLLLPKGTINTKVVYCGSNITYRKLLDIFYGKDYPLVILNLDKKGYQKFLWKYDFLEFGRKNTFRRFFRVVVPEEFAVSRNVRGRRVQGVTMLTLILERLRRI